MLMSAVKEMRTCLPFPFSQFHLHIAGAAVAEDREFQKFAGALTLHGAGERIGTLHGAAVDVHDQIAADGNLVVADDGNLAGAAQSRFFGRRTAFDLSYQEPALDWEAQRVRQVTRDVHDAHAEVRRRKAALGGVFIQHDFRAVDGEREADADVPSRAVNRCVDAYDVAA